MTGHEHPRSLASLDAEEQRMMKLDSEAYDRWWLQQNWKCFWSTAQDGFAERGRGAVLIDVAVTIDDPTIGERPQLFYLPRAGVEELVVNANTVLELVDTYDPKSEVVVMLHKDDGGVDSYLVRRTDKEANLVTHSHD